VDGKSPTKRRTAWIAAALLVVLSALAWSGCGADGSEEAKGQTVEFQKPTQTGKKPFTKPADVQGTKTVQVGSGPFGGTGSDLVCDRELLIRSLKAFPEKMREWARVVKISPDYDSVAKYIRELTPVTLTQDTRVTNHNFVNGQAVGYQAILQAGTAVLVDKYGIPRARCRCGNPLLEPIYYPKATCYGCPKDYHPPPPCDPYSKCYEPYPDPPPVEGETSSTPATPPPTTSTPTESQPPPQQPPPQQTTGTESEPSVTCPANRAVLNGRCLPQCDDSAGNYENGVSRGGSYPCGYNGRVFYGPPSGSSSGQGGSGE
jgi:cell division septation protein DedD